MIAIPGITSAQFAWPKPEYNVAAEGVYTEDPFIIEYRRKFFGVFRGDFAAFEKGYAEVSEMVRKNPKDARALVWVGNGQTIKAGLLRLQRKEKEALELLTKSRGTLDRAVSLRPDDPNIYMMRAATLYIQGQYFDGGQLPNSVWERLRDDCEKFIAFVGPERMKQVSIHVRGEAYGELGIAYKRLGEKAKAIAAFERVIELNPNTTYSERAKREIDGLKS
ncbi:MAG: tetratricopeptide repeat protein [Fimbriimonadaceae bacterium]|nr:tetratricopeptide repeat protein [Fimbriimonadaceae bacterium]